MDDDILKMVNLKYFCDAVRLGSITGSAKANFVTQSAISQGILKLEQSLGVKLIAHHPNCFRMTPDGEMIFKEAMNLLQRVADFKTMAKQEKDRNIGDLEFACTYSFVLAVLSPYLKKFRDEYPRVKIHFELGKNQEIKQMLKAGRVDFGILPDEGDLEDFHKKDIYSGQFKLYTSQKIKLNKQSNPGLILAPSSRRETNLAKQALKEAYLKKFGKEAEVIMEIGSWEVIVNLVAEGMGAGYFPDFFGSIRKADLQECKLDRQFPKYCMSAIFLRGMKLRKSSEIFLSYFTEPQ